MAPRPTGTLSRSLSGHHWVPSTAAAPAKAPWERSPASQVSGERGWEWKEWNHRKSVASEARLWVRVWLCHLRLDPWKCPLASLAFRVNGRLKTGCASRKCYSPSKHGPGIPSSGMPFSQGLVSLPDVACSSSIFPKTGHANACQSAHHSEGCFIT